MDPAGKDGSTDRLRNAAVINNAIEALHLECKFTFQRIPTDVEFHQWVAAIKGDQLKLVAIIRARNPWVLRFAESIPNFWNDLGRALSGKP